MMVLTWCSMKLLIRLFLLSAVLIVAPISARAQAPIPTTVPMNFATINDATLFITGFLDAEAEIALNNRALSFYAKAQFNRTLALLFSRAGNTALSFYFYGRVLCYENAAHEAGELNW